MSGDLKTFVAVVGITRWYRVEVQAPTQRAAEAVIYGMPTPAVERHPRAAAYVETSTSIETIYDTAVFAGKPEPGR